MKTRFIVLLALSLCACGVPASTYSGAFLNTVDPGSRQVREEERHNRAMESYMWREQYRQALQPPPVYYPVMGNAYRPPLRRYGSR